MARDLVEPRTRHHSYAAAVAVAVATALVVSGCGVGGSAPTGTAATAPGCAGGSREVTSELILGGSVCVPDDAERVAVLETGSLTVALTSDVRPVAYSGFYADILDSGSPELEADSILDEAVDVDTDSGVSLEALAAARPDLIIAYDNAGELQDDLALYQEIAATVMLVDGAAGQGANLVVADALGRADEVAADYDALDERVAALSQSFSDGAGSAPRLSTIAFFGGPDPYVFAADSGFAYVEVLDRVGVELVPEPGVAPQDTLSRERLDVVDGEELIVIVGDGDRPAYEALLADPLWQGLDVVQRGDAADVGTYWFNGSPYELHKVVDDIVRLVGDIDPASVPPNPFLNG